MEVLLCTEFLRNFLNRRNHVATLLIHLEDHEIAQLSSLTAQIHIMIHLINIYLLYYKNTFTQFQTGEFVNAYKL